MCCCWLVVQLIHMDSVQENVELVSLLDFTFSSLFHFQHRFLECGCWKIFWIFEDLDWQKFFTPLVSIEVFTTKEDSQHLLWKEDKIIRHILKRSPFVMKPLRSVSSFRNSSLISCSSFLWNTTSAKYEIQNQVKYETQNQPRYKIQHQLKYEIQNQLKYKIS